MANWYETIAARPLDNLRQGALSEYVAALGGRLEIRAVFPDHEVRITQFEELP